MSLPLEIKKIEIKGLYHKSDVSFDMDRDCSIIIGENGIGKTSALKILDYLLLGMMTSVAVYDFELIKVIDSENTYVLKHEDFIVPLADIKEAFRKECLIDITTQEAEKVVALFDAMLAEIQKRGLLGSFLDELFYAEKFDIVLEKIAEKYIDLKILSNLKLKIAFPYPCYEASPIYRSIFYKNISQGKYWNHEVIFGDMVEKVMFPIEDDNFVHFSFGVNKVTENQDKTGKIYKYFNCQNIEECQKLIKTFKSRKLEMHFDELKNGIGEATKVELEYDFIVEGFQNKLNIALMRKQKTFKVFDIHSAIRAMYFPLYTVQEANNIAVKAAEQYYEALIENNEILEEETIEILNAVDDTVLYLHENYIRPILAEEIPYKVSIAEIKNKVFYALNYQKDVTSLQQEILLLKTYMNIYEELQVLVLSQDEISDEIRSMQDLLNQYIDDKKICITPKGIQVYLRENPEMNFVVKTNDGWIEDIEEEPEKIIFGDEATEIPLSSLSSGECKIVMLAFYAVVANRAILVMDEPELSISILWQQKLLRDLLDYGQFKTIIVATHSPYIARDESLSEYIEYLP